MSEAVATQLDVLRVLLVDDDEEDYLLTRSLLEEAVGPQCHVDWASGYEEALEAISRAQHDAYLLDYHLGDRDGVTLLNAAVEAGCRAPLILLTGQGGLDVDLAAMAAGAADFLVKGKIDADRLGRTIRYALERKRNLEAVERERELRLAAENRARHAAERSVRMLEQQNQRLQQLDRMKDEFVAVVSHELRTPLTSIRGYLDLLLDEATGRLTDEQRDYLAVVDRNADRLLRLVSELLLLSQADEGALSIDRQPTELNPIVRESVQAAQPVAEAKDLQLDAAYARETPIDGDRDRLTQLVDNLISNAVKFTPAGGKVTVTTRTADSRVAIEVADTGPGISADDQQNVFEPFFRTQAAAAMAVPGSGLGLAICKVIAQAHGGTIGVRSDGKGTTFHVELPLRREA